MQRVKPHDDDDRYIPRKEMKEFILSNLDTASLFTVRLMYEFFKCAIEDEQENG